MVRTLRSCLISIAAFCLLAHGTAKAQDNQADFYKGKTINFYIGWAAGSGYDHYGRLTARHLSKHLPGNPNIVPLNQPGAGSIALANRLYNTLPKDGTALGMVGNALYLQQFLGEPNIQFDAAQFAWIGRLADLPLLLVSWHTSPVHRPEDVFTKRYNIAVPGAGSSSNLVLSFVKRLVGAQYNLILGYQNGNETRLAMERGEADATASIDWPTLRETNQDWLVGKKINLLAVLGLTRLQGIGQVPLLSELATKEDHRKIIEVFMLPAEVGRAIIAPPGLPDDRVKVLRTAFDTMIKDPELAADAQKQRMELSPMSGKDLESMVLRVKDIPPPLAEQARTLAAEVRR